MEVPFIQDTYHGEVPVNYYPASDHDRRVIMWGTSGLSSLVTPAAAEVRAFRVMGDYLYALVGNGFYQIDSDWNATLKGNKASFYGPAWIEHNGTQVGLVGRTNLHVYTPSADTWEQVTTGSVKATSFTYQDGYGAFVDPDSEQFYLTGLYDFTSLDVLDYASAEGWPDNLVAIRMLYRELWLGGTETIEIWQNTGDTFPFGRAPGGFIQQGVSAAATLVPFDNGMAWLNHQKHMNWAQGRQPIKISTSKMDREIADLDVTDATAFEYAENGHTFLVLNIPGDDCTRVYDAATKMWHKRRSFEGTNETRWRGNCHVYWNNQHIVGDYDNGKIYELSPDYYDDDGTELAAQLESNEITSDGKKMFFNGLQIIFDHGKATGTLDPQAMLTFSDDGGNTWSNELWRSMGKIGEYSKLAKWWRLGSADHTRIFKLRITDAVNRNILGVNLL